MVSKKTVTTKAKKGELYCTLCGRVDTSHTLRCDECGDSIHKIKK